MTSREDDLDVSDSPPVRRRWRFHPGSLAVSSRLAATIVALSVASLLAATAVGLNAGWDLRRDLDDEQLVARQSSGAADVRAYVEHLRRTVAAAATSPRMAADLAAFSAAYETLLEIPATDLTDERQSIIATYQERYLEPINALGIKLELSDVAPTNVAATYLQHNYAIDEDIAVDPEAIDDAGDGSDWSAVHAEIHPGYRSIADSLELNDVYLIEASTGNIVYSLRKRPELGTSLSTGPFSGTGLSSVVDQVRRDPEGGTVVSDLSYYIPALPESAAFVAAPILLGDDLVGVLAISVTGESIDNLLRPPTRPGAPDEESDSDIDLFLFGGDGTLRTDPVSFLDAPAQHLADSIENESLTARNAELVDSLGSTAFVQTVPPATLTAATTGEDSATERMSVTGVETLSVVSPVDVDQVEWYLAAEVPLATVEADLTNYAERLIAWVAALVILVAFGAVAWAATLLRPIRALGNQLGPDLENPIDVPLNDNAPTEFRELVDNFTSMTDQIHQQRREVDRTRQRRLNLLRTLLPPAVAERIAEGEAPSVDEVPRASVAVVVVIGLSEIVTAADGVGRDTVDAVLADIDMVAERHQLERVKVVGDAYFAACGHDRPFIDHAPRTVAFATEVRDLLGAEADGRDLGLGVSVGVASGPVLAGMTADSGGVYDVWGDTVNEAHYLARLGSRDEILITEQTSVLLPDHVATVVAPDQDGSIRSVEPTTVGGTR